MGPQRELKEAGNVALDSPLVHALISKRNRGVLIDISDTRSEVGTNLLSSFMI